MSKPFKVTLVVVLVIFIGIGLFIYISFAGLPWKKVIVGNQTLDYLEKKYNEEFAIDDRFYNFKDGHYGIKVHPTGNPSLTFFAEEGWGNYEFVDYYPEEIWTKQAEKDFHEAVESTFPNMRNYNIGTVYGEGMDIVENPPIPHYIDCQAYIDIGINIAEKFTGSNEQFSKMFSMIQFIQKNGGNVSLFIAYEPVKDDSKNMEFATFSSTEIQDIKSIDDVKKYYNNLES